MLEIVDHSLSIEIIHGHGQEVPAGASSAQEQRFQRKR